MEKSFLLFILSFSLWSFEILETGFVEPSGNRKMNHGSSLLELSDGSLMSCWFGGTKEAHEDTEIFCRKKDFQSQSWNDSKVVVQRQERPVYVNGPKYYKTSTSKLPKERRLPVNRKVGNTVLMQDDDGFLWIFYTVVPAPFGGWGGSNIQYKISKDLGDTWSEGFPLDRGIGVLVKNRALKIAPGEYLLPAYSENGRIGNGFKKFGYTLRLTIKDGKIIKKRRARIPGKNHLQPALARKDENTIVAYLRNRNYQDTYYAEYDIEQNKWGEPKTINVPNSNSPLAAINNQAGEIVIAYNNSYTRPRTPLTIAKTKADDTEVFENVFNVESDPEKDFAYPCLIQTQDGKYHLTYSSNLRDAIKYVVFTLD